MQVSSADDPSTFGWSIVAGLAYFAIVFPIAFAFGIFRTLLLEPAIGKMAAVVIELPFLLAVSWLAALWLVSRFSLPARLVARLTMGGVAFVVLMGAEVCFSVLVFGQPLTQYLESYEAAAGQLGLAGQIAFAFLPSVQLLTTRPAKFQ